jgi:hypothetical protein
MATGPNPRYVEEVRIGGGYGDPVDGGTDIEKDGDILTNGDLTAEGDITAGLNEAVDHTIALTAGSANTAALHLRQAGATNGAVIRYRGSDNKLAIGTRNGSTTTVDALDVAKGSQNVRVLGALGVGGDAAGSTLLVQVTPVTKTVTSLTRSGSTATATASNHGFVTGNFVNVVGANEMDYNGAVQVTVVDANTFTYTLAGTPASPATGTITAKVTTVIRIEDVGTNAPMFLLPNASCASLNPGVSLGTGTINNLRYGHLCLDITGNDTRDAFAVRTNSGVYGGALNAIPLVVNCSNRVGINNSNPAEALDVTGNAKLSGSVYANGGDVAGGAQATNRGILTGWHGAGGNTPGCIKLGSPNGTVWYLFIEDSGRVKVHNALPTSNANGSVVGLQY